MWSGTSPAIAALSSGYEAAFEANTSNLWTDGSADETDHMLGMATGTSPAIAALATGGYETAFQANTTHLWTSGTADQTDTGLGMASGTSPAITGLAHGGYEVAFQANTGILWLPGSAGTINTGLTMASGTNPTIAGLAGGGYEVAFQAAPPPPAPVVSTPVATPVPQPPAGKKRLRIKLTLRWTWNRTHTRLVDVMLGRHPRHDPEGQVPGHGVPHRAQPACAAGQAQATGPLAVRPPLPRRGPPLPHLHLGPLQRRAHPDHDPQGHHSGGDAAVRRPRFTQARPGDHA
jgi:hypothetical protein